METLSSTNVIQSVTLVCLSVQSAAFLYEQLYSAKGGKIIVAPPPKTVPRKAQPARRPKQKSAPISDNISDTDTVSETDSD